jgi:hypothetical protein
MALGRTATSSPEHDTDSHSLPRSSTSIAVPGRVPGCGDDRRLAGRIELRARHLTGSLVVVLTVAAMLGLRVSGAAAIADGDDVTDGDYGFSALLTMTGLPTADGGTRDSRFSCALVGPRWVITAGHCFRDVHGKRISCTVARRTTATIGRTDLRSPAGPEMPPTRLQTGRGYAGTGCRGQHRAALPALRPRLQCPHRSGPDRAAGRTVRLLLFADR